MATVTGTKRKLSINVEALEANNTLTLGSNAVATQSWVTSTIIDGAPDALNTLNELAAAINDTSDYAATVTAALGNRLRIDAAQGLNATQQAQGRSNLGLGSAATSNTSAFASSGHNHDTQYVRIGSRLSGNASQITYTSIRLWDVSTSTDKPADAADGLLTTGVWDSSGWATQQYHDFHTNKLYLRSKQNSVWQTEWATVWTTDNLDPSLYALASHSHNYAPSSHNHDGRYMRMDADTHTTGGIEIRGSLSRGTYTTASQYHTGADNLVLKGNASGISGIFFESEKDGTNINHASDFGFIQYHAYGTGTSGEANELVIGVSNDADDHVVLNAPNVNGLKFRTGSSETDYTIWHSGNFDPATKQAAGSYAAASHTHDDRYYTESESDSRYAGRGFLNEAYVDVYVQGDADTFYPVRIAGGAAYGYQRYSVSRRYNWTAPDTWYTSSHRGGLTLTVEWSGDTAWGGNHKPIRVIEFGESYSNMVGGLALPVTGGLMVWLRGGNAQYRFHCPAGVEQSITVELEGFTAGNGSVYSPRNADEASTGRSNEIYGRWPVRGDNDLYDSNQRVATQTWVGDNYQAAGSYAASNHNHTYDVNNAWLRDNGDNANVKLYGNSRQMAFRTDGTSEYASGVGGYPFAWMYGGDAANQRLMLINTSGQLWLSNYGWLHDKFADINHNHNGSYLGISAKAADSNLLDGIDSTGFVKQLGDTTNPDYLTPSSRRVDPNSRNPTNEHYAISTFGNGGNVTGQIALHFQTGAAYVRGYNSSWSDWKTVITSANIGTQSVAHAYAATSIPWSGITSKPSSFTPSSHTHAISDVTGLQTALDGKQSAGSYASLSGSYGQNFYVNALYYDDWVRNHSNTNGIYWSTTGWHLYPIDNDDFRFRSGNSSSSAIRFNTGGTDRNYVYNNSSNEIGFLSTSRGWIFKVTNSGTATATGDVVAFSDRRLKENIETIPNALEKVEAMRGVTFTRKDTGKESIGLIAQEVEEVIPEVVNNEGEYKGVAYGNLVGVLIEAVKELSAEVKELKAKLGE